MRIQILTEKEELKEEGGREKKSGWEGKGRREEKGVWEGTGGREGRLADD